MAETQTITPAWGAGDVSPDAKHPDQTLQMLVHLCHVKDWELANGDIQDAERLAYYADLVKYVREEMKS
jgi:hypothetical protein